MLHRKRSRHQRSNIIVDTAQKNSLDIIVNGATKYLDRQRRRCDTEKKLGIEADAAQKEKYPDVIMDVAQKKNRQRNIHQYLRARKNIPVAINNDRQDILYCGIL